MEERYGLLTQRVYTPSEKRAFARLITSNLFEDRVDEDAFDLVIEDEKLLGTVEKMIGAPNPDSILRQLQGYMDTVIESITDETIEDELFLLHEGSERMNISDMRRTIVKISESLLRERQFQQPFFRLVYTYIQTFFKRASDETKEDVYDHMQEQYLSPYDERLHRRIYQYVAVRVIARAYRSYKLRFYLPIVANKARLKDEIEYRPLTGIKYFEAKAFFERKEWLD
jgi:hypothetical protein